jgi:hypothetical protein
MNRRPHILLGLGVFMLATLVFIACDDEDTQAEANEAFCDATANYIAALRDVRDLDADSSQEELEDAVDTARDAYDSMVEASLAVTEARLDSVEEARADLQSAIDNVSGEATIGEGLEEVDDEVVNVIIEVSQVQNSVACGIDPGDDSSSDE